MAGLSCFFRQLVYVKTQRRFFQPTHLIEHDELSKHRTHNTITTASKRMEIQEMKRLFIAALAALGLAFGVGTVAMAEGYAPQKVVYHINYDNPKRQQGALRNIQNHINAVGVDKLDLKVVMHGNGLSLLTYPEAVGATKMKVGNASDDMQARVSTLKGQGVAFLVCANTVKGRNINVEDHLYDVEESDIVPSGVAELASLQNKGYAYIKP
jgi:hypothetical protein